MNDNGIYGMLEADRSVRRCTVSEWAREFQTADRIVAQTRVGEYFVSTVFLGIDSNYWTGADPRWFETAIFDDDEALGYKDTASTWEEAENAHRRACSVALAQQQTLVHAIGINHDTELTAADVIAQRLDCAMRRPKRS